MPNVLVPIAEGSEELEAVTIIDILRRGGVDVTVAGLDEGPVTMSRGVKIAPDATLDAALADAYDMVVLPGGAKGAEHMANDSRINALLKAMAASGKFTGAICAAPTVLAKAGLLAGKRATGYPGHLEKLGLPDIQLVEEPVVRDGQIVTSRGPGTAMDFALALVELLVGVEKRAEVEKGLERL